MDIWWLTFAINGVTISHTQYITMLSFEKVIYYAVHYIKYDKFLNSFINFLKIRKKFIFLIIY